VNQHVSHAISVLVEVTSIIGWPHPSSSVSHRQTPHTICTVHVDVQRNALQNQFVYLIADMLRLKTGIRSEKCVVRRLHRCANVYLHKPR